MTDVVSKEVRSKMMSGIRSVSKLEKLVTKSLWNKGLRFQRNTKDLMGKPDISIKKYKVVVFIDSCFWHSCPLHATKPKSNSEFWDSKLKANAKRDRVVNEYYIENGWSILRVWEHEFKTDFEYTVQKIFEYLLECKASKLKGG